ncbi:hypothetical protein [Ramlibacter sp. Leaf400]|uniref:hypothetical protein n=1 Tax=Ramlibacter sp. Leaf400 TaxID=1736365 RepID=UPI0006FE91E5|nr:hypothetical protein [Ramlibacter sp. Leaf400]KQT09541.1 plasmid replication/partition related protein [Ramlibacter sp. Leaf400]
MDIVVNETIKAYIDPLTPEEYRALERSILAEGCRDALVLWGNMLVDGHNRYAICRQHDVPFQTVQSTRFGSIEDVHLWMIDQHLGRRSLSDFQRGVLALRKREIVAERLSRTSPEAGPEASAAKAATAEASAAAAPAGEVHETTREALARVARLSSSRVMQIERIQKQAVPEVVAAVKAGEISINAAATVASLPREEQVAAATGGKEELKQAARRVRESRKTLAVEPPPRHVETAVEGEDTIESLRQRVAVLAAENMRLREQLAQLQREA